MKPRKVSKPEEHPTIQHAQKITHREPSGKFKPPPGAGKIAPKDPPAK